MTADKELLEKAEEWCRDHDAANCVDVYLAGYDAALAGIKIDQGDLLGCCADYAEEESDGGGTAGMSLKEMLAEAYFRGADLAVERIKEGRWRK